MPHFAYIILRKSFRIGEKHYISLASDLVSTYEQFFYSDFKCLDGVSADAFDLSQKNVVVVLSMAILVCNNNVIEMCARFIREVIPRDEYTYMELASRLPYWQILENLLQSGAWPAFELQLGINDNNVSSYVDLGNDILVE